MPSPGNDQAKRVKTDSPVNKTFNSTGTPSSPSTTLVSNSNSTNNNNNNTANNNTAINKQNIAPSAAQSERYIQTLLQNNNSLISEIKGNIDQRKITSNVNLINKFRDNIIQILTCMSMMEGIMSQMPPIPVKLSTICVPKGVTNNTPTSSSNQPNNQQPQPSQQNIVTTPSTPQDNNSTTTFQNMLGSSNGGGFMMNNKKML